MGIGVVPEQVSLADGALGQRARPPGVATPGRLLDIAAEQEEGRPDPGIAQHVEELRRGRPGSVIEGQREHRPTILGRVRKLRLVQLPVPPPAALAATGNVPLAAGYLAVAAQVHGLHRRLHIEVVEPAVTDALGDTLLADHLARDEPDFVGFSLYLWNSERSLHLARE